MRGILKITNYYKPFLRGLKLGRTYEEAYKELMGYGFGWADYYTKRIGGREIVANSLLQRIWALEHGVNKIGEGLVLEQIKHYKPEVVFFEDVNFKIIKGLKKEVPSIKLLIGYRCYPTQCDYRDFDLTISCSESFPHDYVIGHSFEPLETKNTEEEDFVFYGSFIRGGHRSRIEFVKGLDLKIYGSTGGYLNSFFSDKYDRPLYGKEMLKNLAKAKIGFNIHGEIAKEACNMRMFETTGVGVCLLTDNLPNKFFNEDEIVTYDSVEDCKEKVRWLLEHPKERREIALRGQKRTLENYTYEKRAEKLKEIIEEIL